MESRPVWLRLSDAELLRQCEVDTYRASGPGGQKRNKTSSAVRLRHAPSGLRVIAEESRSQHENKARALRRLREALATRVRRDFQPDDPELTRLPTHLDRAGRLRISTRHEDYWPLVAVLLDALQTAEGEIRRAAAMTGLSTGQFSGLLTDDEKTLAEANRIRRERGLRPLRAE